MNNEELEEIFENTSFVTMMIIRDWVNKYYISKDEVLKALGYEENDEEYKRMDSEEKVISLIRLVNSECNRLEDIEDRKVEVAVNFIEERRDKYWQDKINNKIKELEKNNKHYVDMISGKEIRSLDDDKIDLLKELIEEE